MSDLLCQALTQLNLQPGQSERVQVNGYQVEIRRLQKEESEFADSVMLEPWATFPDGKICTIVPVRVVDRTFPDPPVIPDDEPETP